MKAFHVFDVILYDSLLFIILGLLSGMWIYIILYNFVGVMYMILSEIMNYFDSEFSASNDENKENFSERESILSR